MTLTVTLTVTYWMLGIGHYNNTLSLGHKYANKNYALTLTFARAFHYQPYLLSPDRLGSPLTVCSTETRTQNS